jgi:hypothetical protein
MWIANASPFSDTDSAWRFSAPSSLNAFKYTDSLGLWRFDFKHLNGAANGMYFADPPTSGEKNYLVDSYYLNNFSNLNGLTKDSTPGDGMDDSERGWLSSLVFSMGNWGTKCIYYIDVTNVGNSSRTLQFNVGTSNFFAVIYDVREFSADAYVNASNFETGSNLGHVAKTIDSGDWGVRQIFNSPITLPANARRVIKVSYLCGVGTTGFQNNITLN